MDAREFKQYERFKEEAQFLRGRCQDLEQELRVCRPALYRADQRIDRLEQINRKYRDENKRLKQKLSDLTAQLKQKRRSVPPAFVKANVPERTKKKPGRRKGHAAALRAMPEKIDADQDVPVPIDNFKKPCCPRCSTQ
jgi:chromosome segregation ATPase